jgi:N-acetylglutamate synthase-like GNAT family acetyltransferase
MSLTAKPNRLRKFSRSMNQADSSDYIIREACQADIPQLEEFVNRFVQANRLLPRTTDELSDLIPFGFVAVAAGQIVGFAALEIYSAKLAEVRSLAVDESFQGRGIGRGLVQRCVDLAIRRNVLEVMAITSSDRFFQACGFDFTLPGEKKALFIQTREHF